MRAIFSFVFVAGLVGVLATPAAAQPVINEFVANHTGADTNEYIEVFGSPSTDLSNLWVVEIEGDSGQTGLVDDMTFNVGVTDANGIWWTGYTNNVLENGSVTILLVSDFTGVVGNDIDGDDNGVIDTTFWSSILDCVGVSDGGAGDLTYCSTVLDSTVPPPGGFTPGGASRIPNGVDTDSAADWALNDFDGAGIPGFPGTLDTISGEVLNTPGEVNMVPEPASVFLLGLGSLCLFRRRR